MRLSRGILPPIVPVLIVILVLVAAQGCGGDGEEDGGSVVIPSCMSFDAAGTAAAGTVVADQGTESSCDRLEVVLWITGVNDVDKVEFTVTYNAARTSYRSYSLTDSVMVADGTAVTVTENPGSGSLNLVLDRDGPAPGVDAAGTELLVRLVFDRVTSAGFSGFSFSNERIWGSEDPPVLKIGVDWSGGTIWLN